MEYLWIKEVGLLEQTGKLAQEVARLIQDGWKPQGGVSVSIIDVPGEKYYLAAQAMVKE